MNDTIITMILLVVAVIIVGGVVAIDTYFPPEPLPREAYMSITSPAPVQPSLAIHPETPGASGSQEAVSTLPGVSNEASSKIEIVVLDAENNS